MLSALPPQRVSCFQPVSSFGTGAMPYRNASPIGYLRAYLRCFMVIHWAALGKRVPDWHLPFVLAPKAGLFFRTVSRSPVPQQAPFLTLSPVGRGDPSLSCMGDRHRKGAFSSMMVGCHGVAYFVGLPFVCHPFFWSGKPRGESGLG